MGVPYSLDLRKRVIEAVDNGMTQVEAARIFNVSRKSICNWLDLSAGTKSLAAKVGYQKGHSNKIVDMDEFNVFVKINRLCSGEQIADKWRQLKNVAMGSDVVYRALKECGYTFKKRSSVAWKQKP